MKELAKELTEYSRKVARECNEWLNQRTKKHSEWFDAKKKAIDTLFEDIPEELFEARLATAREELAKEYD
jgi:hypothetical protein